MVQRRFPLCSSSSSQPAQLAQTTHDAREEATGSQEPMALKRPLQQAARQRKRKIKVNLKQTGELWEGGQSRVSLPGTFPRSQGEAASSKQVGWVGRGERESRQDSALLLSHPPSHRVGEWYRTDQQTGTLGLPHYPRFSAGEDMVRHHLSGAGATSWWPS